MFPPKTLPPFFAESKHVDGDHIMNEFVNLIKKVDELNRLINLLLNVVSGQTHILQVKVFAVKKPNKLCNLF